jgi:hypothetical protein
MWTEADILDLRGAGHLLNVFATIGVKCGSNDAFKALYLHTKYNEWGRQMELI